jgi:tRNA pseudouridine synthase 10
MILMIFEKAKKILSQPVCDHCLGRQFAQLLSGHSNPERALMIKTALAMSIDRQEHSEKEMDLSNFYGFKFHNLDVLVPQRKKCSVCSNLFDNLDAWIKRIEKSAQKIEFNTFLVGSKLSLNLIENEESLWERVGIDFCEPIKAEINREIGKRVEKTLGKKFSQKSPDINIILNFDQGKADIEINPIFIYGEYQKLARGIPQTRWPSGKYKNSVEQIIARPYMTATSGKGHKLHAMGREDIDARCLGWRPFVLEILEPKFRTFQAAKLAKKIDKKVRVRNLRSSDIAEVRKIKEARSQKTYRAYVICEGKIKKSDLSKLKALSQIKQKTPQRVLHRRADKYRNRKVISLKAKFVNSKKFIIEIRGEAGLYIKELVSGDEGRTDPSISGLLGNKCVCKDLDVINIHF